MKRIILELSDDAYRRLRTMVRVGGIADSGAPTLPVMARIVDDIDQGKSICTLKTAEERDAERTVISHGHVTGRTIVDHAHDVGQPCTAKCRRETL